MKSVHFTDPHLFREKSVDIKINRQYGMVVENLRVLVSNSLGLNYCTIIIVFQTNQAPEQLQSFTF